MTKIALRPLKVFLCHASGDKPAVRELYKRLVFEGVDAWLDQEKLLPGQDWRVEIPRAVEEADVVIVCLSQRSVTKEGYVQKEIKFALDIAEEKPDGTIFLIPARLEDCPVPERISRWQWVDLYEENGFLRLLRSLKLRAEKVGAVVAETSYEDEDKERERKFDQYYTEGLAAFYTEDWDKACRRFQSILSEQPNHKNAAEKLKEAEHQRDLSKLYSQSVGAYQTEDWQTAITTLEELLKKSTEYKDAAQLLKNSKKQKQGRELYAEAQRLHVARQWQAVLKVFDQILAIDSAYPDPDGILPTAQKEVAKLKRLDDLNKLYSRAVHEMDAGKWLEARDLLEQVHKTQTGFLATERLLKKVEDEISKAEEMERRKNQVDTLYEQAHGLIRSKKWRKALDKLEEIRRLDDKFIDRDEIFTKAKEEVEHEDKETQCQNELAAKYAEAVRLLQEEKYQEALDKWQEVKAVDSKYPDRQWVQRTARKKLTGAVKPAKTKSLNIITRSNSIKIVGVVLFFSLLGLGMIALSKNTADTPPSMGDNFNSIFYNGSFDHNKWKAGYPNSEAKIYQEGGRLVLEANTGQFLSTRDFDFSATKITNIQADLMIDSTEADGAVQLHVLTTERRFLCGVQYSDFAIMNCFYEDLYYGTSIPIYTVTAQVGKWYTVCIQINIPTKSTFIYVDGRQIGYIALMSSEKLAEVQFHVWNDNSNNPIKGYVDNVIIETRDLP